MQDDSFVSFMHVSVGRKPASMDMHVALRLVSSDRRLIGTITLVSCRRQTSWQPVKPLCAKGKTYLYSGACGKGEWCCLGCGAVPAPLMVLLSGITV